MKTKRSHDPFSVGSRGTDCKLKQVENKVKCFLEIKKELKYNEHIYIHYI